MNRDDVVSEVIRTADALRASLPNHWHDDAVVEFDDARSALRKIDEKKQENCAACGREPALFYNCFRKAEWCPQRSTVTAGQQGGET